MLVVTKEKLEASLCRDSFYDFVRRFWNTIIPETPVWNWHIEFLCNELQTLAEPVFRQEPKLYDLIVNVSPGSTKSTIFSVMFPPWTWTRRPPTRIICGSYSKPLSYMLGGASRRVAMSEKYQTLFPEIVLDDKQKGFFGNTEGGQRFATSTGGSVTGMHGHFLIVDDPINPKKAVSEIELQRANEWFDQTLSTRKIDKEGTPTIVVMQRLHQNDPAGHMLENREIERIRHICLPAELTGDVRPRRMRALYKDGLFDPVRIPRKVLEENMNVLGDYGYAGQFLQRPVPLGGGSFKVESLRVVDACPRVVRVVRYWDKAGTAKKGCFTVGTKMGLCLDRSFVVMDVKRGRWEAAERERVIRSTAIMDGKDCIIGLEQEPGSGGKESAQNSVRNLAGFRIVVDRPVGDKEYRADPYAVQMNGGNVALLQGLWNRAYIAELQYFPFGTYKDQVDSSSGAFALLNKARKAGVM